MLQRVANYVRNHDWFAVVVEIFVILIGLMLALQDYAKSIADIAPKNSVD